VLPGEEIGMSRHEIEFDAEGVTLRGSFYPRGGVSSSAPAVVMAHGFFAVKEMYLDSFAEVLAAARQVPRSPTRCCCSRP
jgi:uncharacterized protein